MEGYIFVHRKIMDSPVFSDPWLFKIWMWCLFKAVYTPQRVSIGSDIVCLERGQFIYGRKKAVCELSGTKCEISESAFYRRMKILEKNGSILQKTNSRYTLVTVVKYDIYQPFFKTRRQNEDNMKTADEHIIKNKQDNNNPLLSPLKKGKRRVKNNFAGYDLELFERMLKEDE